MKNTSQKEPTREQMEEIFAADAEAEQEVGRMNRDERLGLEQRARGLAREHQTV